LIQATTTTKLEGQEQQQNKAVSIVIQNITATHLSVTMTVPRRRDIIRACKTRGWTLQPAVLAEIEDYLVSGNHDSNSLSDLLDVVKGEMATGKAVTESVWKRVKATNGSGIAADDDGDMDERSRRHWEPSTSTSTSAKSASNAHKYTGTNDWHVVNAFQTPRLVYLTMRKQFLVEEKNWSLLGTPEDKVRLRISSRLYH
jgi:hypothetical protein